MAVYHLSIFTPNQILRKSTDRHIPLIQLIGLPWIRPVCSSFFYPVFSLFTCLICPLLACLLCSLLIDNYNHFKNDQKIDYLCQISQISFSLIFNILFFYPVGSLFICTIYYYSPVRFTSKYAEKKKNLTYLTSIFLFLVIFKMIIIIIDFLN